MIYSNNFDFRGKSSKTNKWVYGCYVYHFSIQLPPFGEQHDPESLKHYIFFSKEAGWNMPRALEREEVIFETVGQSTGEMDLAGTFCFSGDIIEYQIDLDETPETGIIKFKDGMFVVNGIPLSFLKSNLGFMVIGNIFDNNEYLERGAIYDS